VNHDVLSAILLKYSGSTFNIRGEAACRVMSFISPFTFPPRFPDVKTPFSSEIRGLLTHALPLLRVRRLCWVMPVSYRPQHL
jgi:hypothetical protein